MTLQLQGIGKVPAKPRYFSDGDNSGAGGEEYPGLIARLIPFLDLAKKVYSGVYSPAEGRKNNVNFVRR